MMSSRKNRTAAMAHFGTAIPVYRIHNERMRPVALRALDKDRNSLAYEKWQQAVFERDERKCQMCGSSENLNAHHVIAWMESLELRYDVDNGITLCATCHTKWHKIKSIERALHGLEK